MKLKGILAAITMASMLTATSLWAEETSTSTMSPANQKQVEKIVHNYLIKNPDVIFEAIQTLQQKQMTEARKSVEKTQTVAPKFASALFHTASDPSLGNTNGKIIIVDFFDYQCPHCVKMTPVLEAIVKANPNVKVVFKEFPIRGPLSEYASKVALAAKNQGKYVEFHKALMQLAMQQQLTEDAILKIAQVVGLDLSQVKADIKSPSVEQQIKNNTKLAQDLQLVGTPAFFVAMSDVAKHPSPSSIVFVPGQVDQEQLLAIIKKVSGK